MCWVKQPPIRRAHSFLTPSDSKVVELWIGRKMCRLLCRRGRGCWRRGLLVCSPFWASCRKLIVHSCTSKAKAILALCMSCLSGGSLLEKTLKGSRNNMATLRCPERTSKEQRHSCYSRGMTTEEINLRGECLKIRWRGRVSPLGRFKGYLQLTRQFEFAL